MITILSKSNDPSAIAHNCITKRNEWRLRECSKISFTEVTHKRSISEFDKMIFMMVSRTT
jgi:hypothetical protein